MMLDITRKELHAIMACFCKPRKPKLRVRTTLKLGDFTVSFLGDWIMATLHDDKTITASIQPVDSKGRPAKVDGIPVWTSDNEAIATVVASADGMSAEITPGTDLSPPAVTITCTLDADLGPGVTTLTAVGEITVVAAQAVTVAMTLSDEH